MCYLHTTVLVAVPPFPGPRGVSKSDSARHLALCGLSVGGGVFPMLFCCPVFLSHMPCRGWRILRTCVAKFRHAVFLTEEREGAREGERERTRETRRQTKAKTWVLTLAREMPCHATCQCFLSFGAWGKLARPFHAQAADFWRDPSSFIILLPILSGIVFFVLKTLCPECPRNVRGMSLAMSHGQE